MAEHIISKTCIKCKKNKSLDEFYKRDSSPDGFRNDCIVCRKEATKQWSKTPKGRISQLAAKRRYNISAKAKIARKRYNQSPKGRKMQKKHMNLWRQNNVIKNKAIHAVNHAIAAGRIKPVGEQRCKRCKNKAQHYHHWSYAKEHWLDVIPVCNLCHSKIHNKS